jgi:CRP/FNR family transcriptional regulator, cyclic AMP receptor protein
VKEKSMLMDTSSTLELIETIESNRLGVVKRFGQGKVLFWQDDPVDSLFVVKNGKVKTCTFSEDGKNRTYGIWGRGAVLGITAHYLAENHMNSAFVLQPADILIISPSELDTLIEHDHACALSVINYLASYVKHFMREVEALSFLDVQERLKRKLESLAHQHGHITPDGLEIDFSVTHEEIAELTGANRTTITAYLNLLKKQGYLWSSGRHLVIVPHDHIRILENLAEAVIAAEIDDSNKWVRRAILEKIELAKILDVLARTINDISERAFSHIGTQTDVGAVYKVTRAVLETLLNHYNSIETHHSHLGSVVIGNAKGDVHDLGKLMTSILLVRAGFKVIDLGVNVEWEQFSESVQEHRASVLAVSSAMKIDRPQQERAREIIGSSDLLKKATLILGGAGFSKESVVNLGAAGYAGSIIDTFRIVQNLSVQKR